MQNKRQVGDFRVANDLVLRVAELKPVIGRISQRIDDADDGVVAPNGREVSKINGPIDGVILGPVDRRAAKFIERCCAVVKRE